jgi:hypothetical protein
MAISNLEVTVCNGPNPSPKSNKIKRSKNRTKETQLKFSLLKYSNPRKTQHDNKKAMSNQSIP